MSSLYVNVLNETEKWWKRRRTKGFFILTFFVPLLAAILLNLMQMRTGINLWLGENLPIMMLSLFSFSFFPLFLSIAAVDAFTGEAEKRTLKLVLVRPISRSKVFTSKVLAMAIYIVIHLGVLWSASVLLGWLMPGGGGILGLLDSMKAYSSTFVPLFTIGLIMVLIAQCFHSSSSAFAMILFIYITTKLLPIVFPQASVWSVFSYTNWYVLWIGNTLSISKLLHTFVILLSYCIMAYTSGWILFERKQF